MFRSRVSMRFQPSWLRQDMEADTEEANAFVFQFVRTIQTRLFDVMNRKYQYTFLTSQIIGQILS